MKSKKWAGISYDNLQMAILIWQNVGESVFTVETAAKIMDTTVPHVGGKLKQLRFGGAIYDSDGNARTHGKGRNGTSTKWRFTQVFCEWVVDKTLDV